jgi:hypothetical protein
MLDQNYVLLFMDQNYILLIILLFHIFLWGRLWDASWRRADTLIRLKKRLRRTRGRGKGSVEMLLIASPTFFANTSKKKVDEAIF